MLLETLYGLFGDDRKTRKLVKLLYLNTPDDSTEEIESTCSTNYNPSPSPADLPDSRDKCYWPHERHSRQRCSRPIIDGVETDGGQRLAADVTRTYPLQHGNDRADSQEQRDRRHDHDRPR